MKALSEWPRREPLEVPPALAKYSAIDEVIALPSLADFETFYFNQQAPVVLLGLAKTWPACRKWQDSTYLHQVLGHQIFPVELGKSHLDADWSKRQMLFSDFYQDYVVAEDRCSCVTGYLAQTKLSEQMPLLLKDISIPNYCVNKLGSAPLDLYAWFGPEGTESPLHKDRRDNIYVQIAGQKLILLFDRRESPFMYAHQEGPLSNSSRVDVTCPDLTAFPNFSLASSGKITILHPGDCLFIPKGAWHYIKSLQPSWSLSFWFG